MRRSEIATLLAKAHDLNERKLAQAIAALANRRDAADDRALQQQLDSEIAALEALLLGGTSTPTPRAFQSPDHTLFLWRGDVVQIYAPDGSETTLAVESIRTFIAYLVTAAPAAETDPAE